MSTPASRVLREIVLWGAPRSIRRATTYLIGAVLAVLLMNPDAFKAPDVPFLNDGHALASLNAALSYAYCDRPYNASTKFHVPAAVMADDSLRHVPLRDVIVQMSGSFDNYCRSLGGHANNENSLMLLEAAVLRAHPDISTAQLGQVLHAFRVAAILAFAWLLLLLGASVGFAAAAIALMAGLLDVLRVFLYCNYPFLFPMVLLSAGFYGLAWHQRWAASTAKCLVLGFLGGLAAAFLGNLRTSYLPIALTHFAAFSVVVALETWPTGRRWIRPALLASAFAVAFLAFHIGLISRFFPEDSRQAQHHSVAHPLVLALSTPPNDLARELGIEWLDGVGAEKALSVDPSAYFLGPRYDAALFTYYRSLWRERPRQMVQVYWRKFASVGPDMLADLKLRDWLVPLPVAELLAPLGSLPNGLWLLAIYVVIFIATGARLVRCRAALTLVVFMLSAAAVLLNVEAGIIYSLWVPQYHSYLALSALMVSVAGAQLLVNRVASAATRVPESSRVGFIWIEALRFFDLRPSMPHAALRPTASRIIQALIVAVLLAMTVPTSWYSIERAPTTDRDGAAQVDGALRWVLCGSPSSGTPAVHPGADGVLDPQWQLTPFREIVQLRAGSISAFCSGSNAASVNRQPLVILHALILSARPQISAAGLAKVLHFLKLSLVIMAAALMFATAMSPMMIYAVAYASVWLLVALQHYQFAGASFAPILLLITVVIYVRLLTRWVERPYSPVVGVIAGIWAALVAAIAPALAPLQWLCFAVFAAKLSTDADSRKVTVMSVGFVAANIIGSAILRADMQIVEPAFEGAPTWLFTPTALVASVIATAMIAVTSRRVLLPLPTVALYAAAVVTLSEARVLFAGQPSLTEAAVIVLFGVLLVAVAVQCALQWQTSQ